MNWHYLEGSEQKGPVTDADLDTLARSGKVGQDTLVWRECLAEWLPYGQVKGGPPAAAPLTTTAPVSAPPGQVLCAECGKTFPPDEVIRHGDQFICAACKPVFLQKLKEGVALPGGMAYAGFGIRFGAKFLDGILLRLVLLVIQIYMLRGARLPFLDPVNLGITILVGGSYHTFFVGKFGATPGKMAAKLRIVNPDGSKVSYSKAAGRYFAADFVSGLLTLYIGYLMVCWDPERRALHDRICATRVIRK
jgi:uncharacterized RDD family membrane protein YckC